MSDVFGAVTDTVQTLTPPPDIQHLLLPPAFKVICTDDLLHGEIVSDQKKDVLNESAGSR